MTDGKASFSWPEGTGEGHWEVFLFLGNRRTYAITVRVVNVHTPIISSAVQTDGGRVRVEGRNLNVALSVVFSDDVLSVDNSGGEPGHFEAPLPERADSGPLYVVGSYGRSESVVFLRRKEITGRIVLPEGVRVELSSLTVSLLLDDVELRPTSDGRFGPLNLPRDVTCSLYTFLPPRDGEEDERIFLKGFYIPGDKTIIIDSMSTALTEIWPIVLMQRHVKGYEAEVRELMLKLPEVRALGEVIARGLAGSLDYLDVDLKQSVPRMPQEHEQALHNAWNAVIKAMKLREGKVRGRSRSYDISPKGGAQRLFHAFSPTQHSCSFSAGGWGLHTVMLLGGRCARRQDVRYSANPPVTPGDSHIMEGEGDGCVYRELGDGD